MGKGLVVFLKKALIAKRELVAWSIFLVTFQAWEKFLTKFRIKAPPVKIKEFFNRRRGLLFGNVG